MARHVVVDVDAGSDDAFAILILLCLERTRGLHVVGITCCHGNTDLHLVSRNVLHVLESIGRTDVPVFEGARAPLLPPSHVPNYYHGRDGLGDLGLPPPSGQISSENAVVALDRLAREYPGLSLLCVGPLTNVALAMKTFPDFAANIGQLYVMGGNPQGPGNVTSWAEFNFFMDPEAAQIVLSCARSPVLLLPWGLCVDVPLTMTWRLEDLGAVSTNHMSLMNQVDRKVYSGYDLWNPCDAFLAAVFVQASLAVRSSELRMSVELHSPLARGMAMVDSRGRAQPPLSTVTVVEEFDFEGFKALMAEVAAHRPSPPS